MTDSFFEDLFPLEENEENDGINTENGSEMAADESVDSSFDPFASWGSVESGVPSAREDEPAPEGDSSEENSNVGTAEFDPFDIEQVLARKTDFDERYKSMADYERAEAAKEAARLAAERKRFAMEEGRKAADRAAEEEVKMLAERVRKERAEEAARKAREEEERQKEEEKKRLEAEAAWREAQIKLEEDRRREAEEAEKAEKARIEAEEKARIEAEQLALAAREAEERALKEKQKREAEEAERKAREEAEAKAQAEAEAKAAAEAEQARIEEEKKKIEEERKKLADEQAAFAAARAAYKKEMSADAVKDALEREFASQMDSGEWDGIGEEKNIDESEFTISINEESREKIEEKPKDAATVEDDGNVVGTDGNVVGTDENDDDVFDLEDDVDETVEDGRVKKQDTENSTEKDEEDLAETPGPIKQNWEWKKNNNKRMNSVSALSDLAKEKKTVTEKTVTADDEEDRKSYAPLKFPRVDYVGGFSEKFVSGPIKNFGGAARTLKIIAIVVAIILVLGLVNVYALRPERLLGNKMEPTYKEGELIIVSKAPYWFAKPQPGDVIIIDTIRNPNGGFVQDVKDASMNNALVGLIMEFESSKYRIAGRVTAVAGEFVETETASGVVPDGCVFVQFDANNEGMVVPIYAIVGKIIN